MAKFYFILLGLFFTSNLSAQKDLWLKISDKDYYLDNLQENSSQPDQYQAIELDLDQLRTLTKDAPKEFSAREGLRLSIPLDDGRMEVFEVWASPIMDKELSDRYPNIKTFKGRSLNNPATLIRMGYSLVGFHAMIQSTRGTILIDPLTPGQTSHYMVYDSKDDRTVSETMAQKLSCGMPGTNSTLPNTEATNLSRNRNEPVDLYLYKAAIACSGEYALYHGAKTKEEALSHITATMNRVNMVMERDLAIRMELIAETDSLIFLDPETDPYTNGANVTQSYQENPAAIEKIIDPSKFDIGHVFVACGGNGVVGIGGGRVCSPGKSLGISCQFSSDARFAIDVVAHEMGHQLYANHSWNNCPGNEDNFSGGSAYEPGSGSTIMSYAGACGGANNIQFNADPYFHVTNLQEILNDKLLGRTNSCADIIPTDNLKPLAIIPYENGFSIPVNTPFELTGAGEDANGDELTYCWEQYDTGPSVDLGSPVGSTPLFRSLPPDISPTRTFPNMSDLINNRNKLTEVLPDYARNLNFRLTVRDNNPEAGGIDWQNLSFSVTDQAGPFLVSFPNRSEDTLYVGDLIAIEWDVAGTSNAPVNCQKVDILLSTDGGNNFSEVLVANTDNDGSQLVPVPNMLTDRGRIKIKAADNIFFDISNRDFTIAPPLESGFSIIPAFQEQQVCLPEFVELEITTLSLLGFDRPIELLIPRTETAGISFIYSDTLVNPGDKSTLQIGFSENFPTGKQTVDIIAIAEGADTVRRILDLNIIANRFTSFELRSPSYNSSGIGLPEFIWEGSIDADFYEIEIATNPAFGTYNVDASDLIEGTSYQSGVKLEESTIYYWHVRPVNNCGSAPWSETYAFQTENLSCVTEVATEVPIFISGQGLPTITSKMTVTQNFTINDLNVTKVKGSHDWVSHIRTSVISPSGTTAILFSGKCPGSVPFDLGFDDESPVELPCPPVSNDLHQPLEALSVFDGENAFGEWTLSVEVIDGFGEGGSLDEWSLEFCGNISPSAPELVVNEILSVKPQTGRLISPEFLLAEDPDNTAEELIYTLVKTPLTGTLLLNREPIRTGTQFTQKDLNQGILKYRHDGIEMEDTDSFLFTLSDQTGGWIGITPFQIVIDPSETTVNTHDFDLDKRVKIFPNPATSNLYIQVESPAPGTAQFTLFDLSGQLIKQQIADHPTVTNIVTHNLKNGMYFLKIKTREGEVTRKVVIQER